MSKSETVISTGQPSHRDHPERDLKKQRSNAVRTAWVLAVIAVIIFAAFVLSGVFGEVPVS